MLKGEYEGSNFLSKLRIPNLHSLNLIFYQKIKNYHRDYFSRLLIFNLMKGQVFLKHPGLGDWVNFIIYYYEDLKTLD